MLKNISLKRFFITLFLALISFSFVPGQISAQGCSFFPMGPALNDLGQNEYYRLSYLPGGSRFNSSTWFYVQQPGIIGGLYPGGNNVRPAGHDVAGLNIAAQIEPLDANGLPSAAGKIGMTSIGMSNTNSEFGAFMSMANADPDINDNLVLVNGAMGGAVIERWALSTDPNFTTVWNNLQNTVTSAGLTNEQVQVAWVKVTQQKYQPNFPGDMQNLEGMYSELARLLKARFPNLKMAFYSSRMRSFFYFGGLSGEPTAFENGFAVRWMLEKQINGDSSLNYDSNLGSVTAPWLSWGPYLWVDGLNARSDGWFWPLSYVSSGDCTHPTELGNQAIANMLMGFFKTDSAAYPWFLNPSVPTPSPTPIVTVTPVPTNTPTLVPTETPVPTPTDTPMPTPTDTPVPTPTDTPVPTPTDTPVPTPTDTPMPTPTDTPVPTPTDTPVPTATPSADGLISYWSFANNLVTDDINGCTDCSNILATWFTPGILNGAYSFGGTNSYLNLGTFPYLNNEDAFTVSVWVRPGFGNTHSSWRYVFADGTNISLFYLSNIRDWRFMVRTTAGNLRTDTQGAVWTPDTWHLLTGTYNGSQLKLYWDGNLESSVNATGLVVGDNGASYLGKSGASNGFYLGAIDELKIYNRALTDQEVSGLFTNP